jgi:hypothetical protein
MGDAPLEQASQAVTVQGRYDSNLLAIVGASLRWSF